MRKEDLVWYEDDEHIVMKDPDGWSLICIINHFKSELSYDVETPDGYTFGLYEPNPYKAIDFLNEKKKTYII